MFPNRNRNKKPLKWYICSSLYKFWSAAYYNWPASKNGEKTWKIYIRIRLGRQYFKWNDKTLACGFTPQGDLYSIPTDYMEKYRKIPTGIIDSIFPKKVMAKRCSGPFRYYEVWDKGITTLVIWHEFEAQYERTK